MQQLNLYRFYELGSTLRRMFCAKAQQHVANMFGPLADAQNVLDGFIKGEVFALESSKADALRLQSKIGAIFNRYFIDPATKQLRAGENQDPVDAHDLNMIHGLLDKFEQSLSAELALLPAFLAGKRGIYSTTELADNAQAVFSDHLRKTIPAAAQTEFNGAGRALVFGMGTAAAVHMLRAVDMMLRAYYEAFVGGTASTKGERNYTMYLKKLAALLDDEDATNKPDRRVIQMLIQVKDHYRNPLLLPETNLSIDEAMQLFGLSSAVISMMAEQLASRQPVTKVNGNTSRVSAVEEDEDSFDYPLQAAQ
ncbi:MAG: hypothetical protein JO126_05140 [Alphaproteobacteria bacterium]|nr:hypothetical protein [Alphaproteobacteria bacterium]